MSDTQHLQHTYANAHVAWLACLYAIADKIRREDLMSIEGARHEIADAYKLRCGNLTNLAKPKYDLDCHNLSKIIFNPLEA